jgi:hypothetical protein
MAEMSKDARARAEKALIDAGEAEVSRIQGGAPSSGKVYSGDQIAGFKNAGAVNLSPAERNAAYYVPGYLDKGDQGPRLGGRGVNPPDRDFSPRGAIITRAVREVTEDTRRLERATSRVPATQPLAQPDSGRDLGDGAAREYDAEALSKVTAARTAKLNRELSRGVKHEALVKAPGATYLEWEPVSKGLNRIAPLRPVQAPGAAYLEWEPVSRGLNRIESQTMSKDALPQSEFYIEPQMVDQIAAQAGIRLPARERGAKYSLKLAWSQLLPEAWRATELGVRLAAAGNPWDPNFWRRQWTGPEAKVPATGPQGPLRSETYSLF